METTRTSFIEQQLSHVEDSTATKSEFVSFLQGLKKVILDLIENPFGGRYNIINQNSEDCALELFNTREARDFLMFMGYIKDADQYVYITSDENMSKLEDCLQIVKREINSQTNAVLYELNGDNIQRKLDRLESKRSKESASSHVQDRSNGMKCSSGLKEFFLSRHMKKEQSFNALEKKKNRRLSDFAFNTNGYFHQSSNARNTQKSKRCFISDLFHKDHHNKGWNSPGCDVKLI